MRYVVMSVAEARASGMRAAGFRLESTARRWAASLNTGTKRGDAAWWQIRGCDVSAIVDTATAADGSPPLTDLYPDRCDGCGGGPCVDYTHAMLYAPVLTLPADGSPGESERRPCAAWHDTPGGKAALLAGLTLEVFRSRTWNAERAFGWRAGVDRAGSARRECEAQFAAEDAACTLLVDALLALGETGREAMRRAMEGRK